MRITAIAFSISCLLCPLLPLQVIAAEEEKVVNIFSWNDYIGPDTLENFSKETNTKVHYDITDTSDVMGPISNAIEYPNAIPDSRKYMSPALLVEGRIFLSDEDLKRTFTSKFLTKLEMRKRNRLWTKFIYNK